MLKIYTFYSIFMYELIIKILNAENYIAREEHGINYCPLHLFSILDLG